MGCILSNLIKKMEDLHDKRKIYEKGALLETDAKANPIEQFRDWYYEAEEHPQIAEANAMAISTVESDGCPRTRMVLLKNYDWDGFIFYTNYLSRKGRALQDNPHIGLHFFWPPLERQVIIKAKAEQIAPNLSDGYFHSRPRGSQLGAVVSPQSEVIPNRDYLEEKLKTLEEQYDGQEIPRPEYWGGYKAVPYEIEFWQGRPNRLHDRLLYQLTEDGDWLTVRLAP